MHWCLGMYGSGSTWVFNVVLKAAHALYPDQPVRSGFAMSPRDLAFLGDGSCIPIVKTHETDDMLRDLLDRRATARLISIRDPRDCLASLLTYHNLTYLECFGRVLRSALFCAALAEHPGALLFRYEDRFFNDPATITTIAATFGHALSDADRDRIYAETRRSAIEAMIANLDSSPTVFHHADPAETLDTVTQWHRHHAGRTGEIGRWRGILSAEQVRDIECGLGEFMERFAYEIS